MHFSFYPDILLILSLNTECIICLDLLISEELKRALSAETRSWLVCYGRYCNNQYHSKMQEIFGRMEDISKRLSHPVKDLDDIRFAMAALHDLREHEVEIERSIEPIEGGFILLRSFFDHLFSMSSYLVVFQY